MIKTKVLRFEEFGIEDCLGFRYLDLKPSGRSAAWLARLPWEQEGAVATNKERLLARPREGERAGPAVQIEVIRIHYS